MLELTIHKVVKTRKNKFQSQKIHITISRNYRNTRNYTRNTKNQKAQKNRTTFTIGIEGNNSFLGIGVIIEKDITANFTRIGDRICIVNVKLEESSDIKLLVIVAYASTLQVSERNPKARRFLHHIKQD